MCNTREALRDGEHATRENLELGDQFQNKHEVGAELFYRLHDSWVLQPITVTQKTPRAG